MKKNLYTFSYLSSTTLLLLILIFHGCWQPTSVEITFAAGPDDTNTLRQMIDKFNEQQEGQIHVNWKEMSRITDENFEELQTALSSNNSDIDVFAADVIWTGTLGAQGLAADLSKQFHAQYESRDFVPAAMKSVMYDFSVYGVPWFTDASMVYYRKDLLDKYGFTTPPTTWDDLSAIARVIMKKENIPYGYVFQGDKYEGGVTSACEFIWSAGGQIAMDNLSLTSGLQEGFVPPSIIAIDSRASENGLSTARRLIEEGISPMAVTNFREQETTQAFLEGKSIFMRGWPSIYGLFLEPGASINANQVGVSPIPTLKPNGPSYSCLGGWNLMISAGATDTKKEAAWAFIEYMTAAKQQKYRALKSGSLPSLKTLYNDEQLLAAVPVVQLAKQEIQNARSRPVSPYYMEYSKEIATVFNGVLKGELVPEYAVYSLQEYLESVQLKEKLVVQ